MQTSLVGQYSTKWPISLVYVLKPLTNVIRAIWSYLGVWSVGAVFKWRSLSLTKSAYWFWRDAFVWRWINDNPLFFGSSDPSSESSVNVALSRPSFKRNFVILYQVWKKFNELSLFDFVYCSIGWIQTDELFRYVRFLFVWYVTI